MTLCTVLFPVSRSRCFGRNPRPIIRSSIKLYSQHLGLTNGVCPAVVVDESELMPVVLVNVSLKLATIKQGVNH
jgi:hypothetical protein